jgi:hypothetical protein
LHPSTTASLCAGPPRAITGPPRCAHHSAGSPLQSASLVAPLAPTQACATVCHPGRTRPSPDGGPPRLAPAAAAERRRPPDQNPKPGQEHPWTTPCTLPPGHGRRPRQNFAIAPATAPRGDIAKRKVFSRACLQIGNSNSKAILLILVNCVENRRNIRFCCIRGEKSYNFCYSLLS